MWLRFGLRTLLLLLAIAAGWLGVQVSKAHKQRVAVVAIREAGGVVTYESSFPEEGIIAKTIGRGFTEHVDFVHMKDRRTTDDDLAPLAYLPHTKMLDVTNCKITDAGLVHVQRLKELEILYLGGTSVSDVGLDVLEEMASLKFIICVDCPMSADRVAAFRQARPDVEIISTLEEDGTASVP